MIGYGRRNLAANINDSSWVLSPISAMATSKAGVINASKGMNSRENKKRWVVK
jgi:hypothetical protein